jgi:hypothetical protein
MVRAINVVHKELMMWPIGDKMKVVMMEFKNGHCMQSVINIDKIHIAITKPYSFFLKTTITTRLKATILLHTTRNIHLLGSVNDSYVLKKFWLYMYMDNRGFFYMVADSQDELPPYIYMFKDKGFPLLP